MSTSDEGGDVVATTTDEMADNTEEEEAVDTDDNERCKVTFVVDTCSAFGTSIVMLGEW